MKQFEECNLLEKTLRYRHLLSVPFYMFKIVLHWQYLEMKVPIESCYQASLSVAYIKMSYFRKIKF